MSSNAMAASSGEREKLRSERKLRLIDDKEVGEPAEFASPGVFGFTYSPGTDGVPIFAKHTFQIFEVHKLGDGSVHYVGYMTEEDANALNSATDAVDLKLYPEPFDKAQRFVSVPKEAIIRSRPVSRESGNWYPFTAIPR
ncbi:MAG: hypothetical protein JNK48_29945 [Bryobacterales bacterium]|nr:hypothetical protein [Bryobacterales bacterium]